MSDKIQYFRKERGFSQEDLAEICGVSRQSVSKWEAGTAFPEIEKIILLSKIFQVTTDFLLREDYEINEVKLTHQCGENALHIYQKQRYEGVLIKESIEDDSVIDYLSINKIELWHIGGSPNYWTVLFFTSKQQDLPERLAKVMISKPKGNWFVDFKSGDRKYIVFRDLILHYTIGNQKEKEAVCETCRKMGISDEQMNWSE